MMIKARYSLIVPKVPLNPKSINHHHMAIIKCSSDLAVHTRSFIYCYHSKALN